MMLCPALGICGTQFGKHWSDVTVFCHVLLFSLADWQVLTNVSEGPAMLIPP